MSELFPNTFTYITSDDITAENCEEIIGFQLNMLTQNGRVVTNTLNSFITVRYHDIENENIGLFKKI